MGYKKITGEEFERIEKEIHAKQLREINLTEEEWELNDISLDNDSIEEATLEERVVILEERLEELNAIVWQALDRLNLQTRRTKLGTIIDY